MNIYQRLTLGFFSTSILVGFTGTVSLITNKQSKDHAIQLKTIYLQEVDAAREIALALQTTQRNAYRVLENTNSNPKEILSAQRIEAQANIAEEINQIKYWLTISKQVDLAAIKSQDLNDTESSTIIRATITKIESELDLYQKLVAKYLDLAEKNPLQAKQFLETNLEFNLETKLLPLIQQYEYEAKEALNAEITEIEADLNAANNLIVAATLFAILVAILVGLLISHSIAQPINKLKKAATNIGQGKLNTKIDIKSKDELGILADTLNKMVEGLSKTTVSKSYLDSILSSMTDSLITINLDTTITKINQATMNLLGYEESDLIGQQINLLFTEEIGFNLANLINHESISNVEVNYLSKSGKVIPVSFSASLMSDEYGNCQGIVCVARDITEQKLAAEALLRAKVAEAAKEDICKALEKEKELSELKSRFVSMTSHEFRTPLTTILSSAELIQDFGNIWNEEKKLQHLLRIQSSVKHMTGLLNDVLLIGKAEAGKLEFKPAPLDLVQFCRELVEELQLTAQNHKIVFYTVGKCPEAYMDEKLLRHIFSNLLSNAIKYSPDGGTVRFELVNEQTQAIFRVQDQGIGIPPADQVQLFDSFHRASNVGTISGTGLGLAIVQKSVDLHNGKIFVCSDVGVGTTFKVTIPWNNLTARDEQNTQRSQFQI